MAVGAAPSQKGDAMIEVEEAIGLLCRRVAKQTATERRDILDAHGCVAARDILSPVSVPQFAKSAMDGYAVRSADTRGAAAGTPVRLRVLGEVLAGDDKTFDVAKGTAVRIMTGGAIPPGYDAVVKQENTDEGPEHVLVHRAVANWENYCPPEEDLRVGERVIQRGTRLGSQHIGVLASMGFAQVEVLRPFRVGVIATGNELAKPGAPLGRTQVYNSSSYTIAADLKAFGVQLAFLEVCRDDEAALCRLVNARIGEVDAIITTGGVSVGKMDIVPAALEHLGAERLFHRVNMKPGTPVLAAAYQGKVLLCLSGNPFAALVNFHVFFWPVLAAAMGCPALSYKRGRAVLCEGGIKQSGLRRFVRALKKGDGVHLYTKNHRSSVFSNLPASNCIIDQPPGKALEAGDEVDVLYWKY